MEEVDEEEEEGQLTWSLSQRGGPQPVSGLPTGGAPVTPAALGANAPSSSVAASSAKQMKQLVAPPIKQVKVRVVEPHHHPCLLSGLRSMVTQAELDEFCHHFSIPRSIFMRVPGMGELP